MRVGLRRRIARAVVACTAWAVVAAVGGAEDALVFAAVAAAVATLATWVVYEWEVEGGWSRFTIEEVPIIAAALLGHPWLAAGAYVLGHAVVVPSMSWRRRVGTFGLVAVIAVSVAATVVTAGAIVDLDEPSAAWFVVGVTACVIAGLASSALLAVLARYLMRLPIPRGAFWPMVRVATGVEVVSGITGAFIAAVWWNSIALGVVAVALVGAADAVVQQGSRLRLRSRRWSALTTLSSAAHAAESIEEITTAVIDAVDGSVDGHRIEITDDMGQDAAFAQTLGPGRWILATPLGASVELAATDVRHLRTAAQIATAAIANLELRAELERSATTDALTGLANRRAFDCEIEQLCARSDRTAGHFTLLSVDVDRLKQVNDRLGHQAGDRLLVHVADSLAASARAGDVVARLGGDEFAVLAIGTTDTEPIVDRFITALDDEPAEAVECGGISASVGAAVFPFDGITPDELIAVADERMYTHKQQRRTSSRRGR